MTPVLGEATKFDLDRTITVDGQPVSLTLAGDTDAGVLIGIAHDRTFPDGAVSIGRIVFGVNTGNDIAFAAGGATVSFGAAAAARIEAGIFTSAADAIGALHIPETPGLDLTLPVDGDADRFFVLLTGYTASGHGGATHPLGMLGSASFGVDAARASVFAVVHRFAAAADAPTVIADTIHSWRLPRHVAPAQPGLLGLAPGTWIVAETDGSLALKLAATLGYDVSFMRQTALAGVRDDLGVRIDAALKATLGFSVAGRYVIVVGREDASARVRVRLFKTTKKGLSCGFNVDAGVTASVPLPDRFDDLAAAVFGQHGLQVLDDVAVWADPATPLANKAAQLGTDTGFDLLRRVAGIDGPSDFERGRARVLAALRQWDALPDRVSAFLWGLLRQEAGANAVGELKRFLHALADPDRDARAGALASALTAGLFGDSPVAQWLQAVAEQGLIALPLDEASRVASQTLDVLDGGVVQKLHDYVDEKLGLDAVRKGDFERVDPWLLARLAAFLGKSTVGAPELVEVQKALTALDAKVRELYAKGLQAATKRYNVALAATYQRATTGTALLDVTFDTANDAALGALKATIDNRFDDLLTTPTPGVSIGAAALTHEIQPKSDVSVRWPLGLFETTHVDDAIASLAIEEHGGRVLVYDIKAHDTVTANRYVSELSLFGRLERSGDRLTLSDRTPLAYEALQIQTAMVKPDLEARTAPFIRTYMQGLFGAGDAALATFFSDLDATIGGSTHRLGDTALAMQVSYPASVLGAWFRPRSKSERKSAVARMSCRLQETIRPLLASAFFADLAHFSDTPPTASLLVWSSLPVASAVEIENGTIRALSTDTGDFWDFEDPAVRGRMASHERTVAKLAVALEGAHARLTAAGAANADAFGAGRVQHFISLALGDLRFHGLLFMEAEIVRGIADALDDISRAVASDLSGAPTVALKAFARFAAALTEAFNERFSAPYRVDALRTLGPAVLVETSAALAGTSPAAASAMLRMYFLKSGHAFQLPRFLDNELPPSDDVVRAQTLVTP